MMAAVFFSLAHDRVPPAVVAPGSLHFGVFPVPSLSLGISGGRRLETADGGGI